jgi:hypothetical protein
MLDPEVKKVRDLETRVKRLEEVIRRMSQQIDYFERERQRMKTDINTISNVLRKQ